MHTQIMLLSTINVIDVIYRHVYAALIPNTYVYKYLYICRVSKHFYVSYFGICFKEVTNTEYTLRLYAVYHIRSIKLGDRTALIH